MPLSASDLRTMAAALSRAADRFDERAAVIEAAVERRRKGDREGTVAAETWRQAARQLRTWAAWCSRVRP